MFGKADVAGGLNLVFIAEHAAGNREFGDQAGFGQWDPIGEGRAAARSRAAKSAVASA